MTARPLRFLGVVLLFALLGPLVVAVVFFGLFESGLLPFRGGFVNPRNAVELFLLVAVICYFVGLPAAAVTGLAAALLSPRLERLPAWLGACASVGAVATTLGMFLLGKGGDFNENLEFAWAFALCGAGAAAVCAFAADRFRPRRVEPDWNPRPAGSE